MQLTTASFVAEPTAVSERYSLSILSEAHSSLYIKNSPQLKYMLTNNNNLFTHFVVWYVGADCNKRTNKKLGLLALDSSKLITVTSLKKLQSEQPFSSNNISPSPQTVNILQGDTHHHHKQF